MGSEIEFGLWFAFVIIVICIAGAVGEYLNDLPQMLEDLHAKSKENWIRKASLFLLNTFRIG